MNAKRGRSSVWQRRRVFGVEKIDFVFFFSARVSELGDFGWVWGSERGV